MHRTGYYRDLKRPKTDRLLAKIRALGTKSGKEAVEYSFVVDGSKLVELSRGDIGSVDYSFDNRPGGHTHPRGCKTDSDCSLEPPSADDMSLIFESACLGYSERHYVASPQYIYQVDCLKVKLPRRELKAAKDAVFKYFRALEDWFDNTDEGLRIYHYVWKAAVRNLKLFKVTRYKD